MTDDERRERGMKIRREVLGDAHVDRAQANTTPLTKDFQDLITRYAWGEIWARPGLDRKTRSCITLTALTALNAERADVGLPPVVLAGAALYAEIMTEKWIEDFQKIETFQDYNRSCFPRLIPALTAAAIPARFLYPINERNSNPNIPAPSAQPVRNQNDPNAC